ncbi:MAG TPA: IS256 family transposase [Vicinamibacterales bacterium]|nr:IS256 family transposase [Vicinamibacterales bacterium]
MKRESRIVDRSHQVDSPTQRHLPLVDLLVDTRAELLELVVSSGLSVLHTMLEEDRTAICGPRYHHQSKRTACRAGTAASEVALGGRKVAIRRPRVRGEGGEVPLPTFAAFADAAPLNRRVVEQMLVGVATRQYARSLEPVPAPVVSRGTSKRAVSRRFVAKTRAQLEAWQSQPLDGLDRVGLVLDGVHVGEHCLIVALGIAADGQKHALGLWEGSTENATLCQSLLANLQSRGLRTDRSLLVILDGSKALRKAVRDLFGDVALVQRCQVHKLRNVLDHLPERQRTGAKAILHRAYRSADITTARRLLIDLARRLETDHPSAAESVREGLDETLTVLGLNLPDTLRRSLTTTNAAESLISRTRHVKRNVKRWRGGQMVVRWVAAGVLEAVKGFRRLKGYKAMPQLVAALRARDQQFGLVDRESIGEVA